MKFSLFTNYGALNSKPIFEAFANGLKPLGHTILYNDINADVFVIWSVLFTGRMAPNKDIWEYAKRHNIPIIVLEVGMLKRNVTWKIGVNGINTLPHILFQDNRSSKLGIELSEWKKTGDSILICGQRLASIQWKYKDCISWLQNLIKMIRNYSERPIIFRPHPREKFTYDGDLTIQYPVKIQNTYDDYDFTLHNVWMVVSPSSSPGIHAIINGIPAHTDNNSMAYGMSTPLNKIESPIYHDRSIWLEHICHTEWTVDEIQDPTILSLVLVDILQK